MKTRIFTITDPKDPQVRQAAEIIRSGGLLGIPTETVYGLGADGLNEDAVFRIFEAKGRPQDNPLILHVPEASWLERYCTDIPEEAYVLAERFWPGPLTMILPRKKLVPLRTTGGLDTVGIRCPDHPVTLAILREADVPIAAPSGNRSGRPSPTSAPDMLEDMDGRIDAIVDGGPCGVGVESTIIDLTCHPPRLLRPGGLPLEALEEVLGEVQLDRAVTEKMKDGERPRAPGMKYRHYAPKAPVTVVLGDPERTARWILKRAKNSSGILCFSEFLPLFPQKHVCSLGSWKNKAEQARNVFHALRSFDATDVTEIWAQCPDADGLGLAVGNRLKKAAGFHLTDLNHLRVLGITGQTGAGKTTLLEAIERRGGTVIDCDALYRECMTVDCPLKRAIEQRFPDCFTDGVLDRKTLGKKVFSDEKELEALNALVFTYLPEEVKQRIPDGTLVGIDAVNLHDGHLAELCDWTIAVTAPEEERCARIMKRDGIDRATAMERICAQKDASYYSSFSDCLLENTEPTAEAFAQKAKAFLDNLLEGT